MDGLAYHRVVNRRRMLWAAGSAVAVVAGIVVYAVWPRADGPADVVRNYLAAIRAKDVDRALSVAGATRPDGAAGVLLTPAAIGDDWRADVGGTDRFGDDATAEVDVNLTAAPGVPDVWPGGDRWALRLALTERDGRWRIDQPLAELHFMTVPVRYLEVNGVRVDRSGADKDGGPSYLAFPGMYTLYRDPGDLATVAPSRIVAWPGSGPTRVPAATVTVTGRGTAAFQQTVNAMVDHCVAVAAQPGGDCRFSNGDGLYRLRDSVADIHDVKTAAWTLRRYPVVNLPGTLVAAPDETPLLAGQVAVPGEVELTASGPDLDSRAVTFTQTCLITDLGLRAAFAFDGTLTTSWSRPVRAQDTPPGRQSIAVTCTAV